MVPCPRGVDPGMGLFAVGVFEDVDAITDYAGDLLSTDQAKAMSVQTHMATLPKIGLLTVDGLRQPVIGKGGGSFANGVTPFMRTRGCVANAALDNDPDLILYLRATRRIEDGEEILWKYGNKRAVEVAMGGRRLRSIAGDRPLK